MRGGRRGEVAYAGSLAASIHETAEDLFELGLIDQATMRAIDGSCLAPEVGGE